MRGARPGVGPAPASDGLWRAQVTRRTPERETLRPPTGESRLRFGRAVTMARGFMRMVQASPDARSFYEEQDELIQQKDADATKTYVWGRTIQAGVPTMVEARRALARHGHRNVDTRRSDCEAQRSELRKPVSLWGRRSDQPFRPIWTF